MPMDSSGSSTSSRGTVSRSSGSPSTLSLHPAVRIGVDWVIDALQLISRLARVVMEHLYGFEGVVVQVLSNDIEFRQNALRDGDDVAARIIGLKDVQQFSRTVPEEFDVGIFRSDLRSGLHDRY